MTDQQGERPGAHELRQAIVSIPIGLAVLLIAPSLFGEGIAEMATFVGVLVLAVGVLFLCAGLYKRVG